MQPYVQKNTTGYESILLDHPSIMECYSFREETGAPPVNAVPDGCVDLLYAFGKNEVRLFIGGTVLRMKYWPMESDATYFGIRFRPGKCIFPKDVAIGDIINTDIEIPASSYGACSEERIWTASDLKGKALEALRIFTEYEKTDSKMNVFSSMQEMESYIRKRIYETKGTVSIAALAQEMGYSECYIRRVFHEMHGISPKLFEKIIRFQNVLDEMRIGKRSLNDLAQETGYYDQSHMVKEFKSFTGLTPEGYLHYMYDSTL